MGEHNENTKDRIYLVSQQFVKRGVASQRRKASTDRCPRLHRGSSSLTGRGESVGLARPTRSVGVGSQPPSHQACHASKFSSLLTSRPCLTNRPVGRPMTGNGHQQLRVPTVFPLAAPVVFRLHVSEIPRIQPFLLPSIDMYIYIM